MSTSAAEERELRSLALSVLMPGVPGTRVPEWIGTYFQAGLASVCLYGENVVSPYQLAEFVAKIRTLGPHAIVAIDEEGGDVTRIHYREGSPYPGNSVLGRLDDEDVTHNTAAHVGWSLRRLGINLDLAPDVDVNSNSDNPVIGTRSFGADPDLVARHAVAWVRGLQSQGVAACAKHFPGHGDTSVDSHLALPMLNAPLETLHGRELVPFQAVADGGLAAVMTSHICVPALDPGVAATYSPKILQGLLRDQIGFEGVVISDALDMQGAGSEGGIPAGCVRALAAGCDLLCLGPGCTPDLLDQCVEAIIGAVEDGSLSRQGLERASLRVGILGRVVAVDPHDNPEPQPPLLPAAALKEAFTGLHEAQDWFRTHPDYTVARVESPASMAVGHVPWGPFSTASEAENNAVRTRFAAAIPLYPDALPDNAPTESPIVVVGRLLHRDPEVGAALQRWSDSGSQVLLVEMGWPNDHNLPFPRLATYGASRAIGDALLEAIAN